MAYTLRFDKRVQKQILAMPGRDREAVLNALQRLAANPHAPGLSVIKLTARDGYRLRVGAWRVLYLLDNAAQLVIVTAVADRKQAYR
ncbi:MAG TPA: type II toxin-antitoxin system RelE/ParE family toxin [Caulobacteraceae bacterium]